MKLNELVENWKQVRGATIIKYPHLHFPLSEANIQVDNNVAILTYSPDKIIAKKIAEHYGWTIKQCIAMYVTDEFELLIKFVEE